MATNRAIIHRLHFVNRFLVLYKQIEIDIMWNQYKSTALFGECKWINENVDVKEVSNGYNKAGID